MHTLYNTEEVIARPLVTAPLLPFQLCGVQKRLFLSNSKAGLQQNNVSVGTDSFLVTDNSALVM